MVTEPSDSIGIDNAFWTNFDVLMDVDLPFLWSSGHAGRIFTGIVGATLGIQIESANEVWPKQPVHMGQVLSHLYA